MMKKGLVIFLIFCKYIVAGQTAFTASANVYLQDCELGAAKITVEGGKPPYFYQWSTGALGDSVSSLPAGNYTVRVSDSAHFSPDATVTFKIETVCQVHCENKFSPNGDGINDTWFIANIANYPKFFLQVFDRWGQVVHQQRNVYTPWDGTHLGIKLPDATYYFVFFYEEGKTNKIEKGNVTLVR